MAAITPSGRQPRYLGSQVTAAAKEIVRNLGESANMGDVATQLCQRLPLLSFGTAIMYGLHELVEFRKRRERQRDRARERYQRRKAEQAIAAARIAQDGLRPVKVTVEPPNAVHGAGEALIELGPRST